MDNALFFKRLEVVRQIIKARGDKPWVEGWSVAWKPVFTHQERLVLSHLYSLTINLFNSESATTRDSLIDQGGGVKRTNKTIAEDTELSVASVKRALASLEAKGALTRPKLEADNNSRVFYVNMELLELLDAAWMTVGNKYDPNTGMTKQEFKEHRENAVRTAWNAYVTGGAWLTGSQGLAQPDPTLVFKSSMQEKEVSSSKKPGLPSGRPGSTEQAPIARRRIPQSVLAERAKSLTPVFRRKPILDAKTGTEVKVFTLSRSEQQVLDHWNSIDTLRTHKLPCNGSAPTGVIKQFISDLNKLMEGTLFKGLSDVDVRHVRAYNIGEVIKAIDAFALADPKLRTGVGLNDFFFNANRTGGQNGYGRSWFLAALHNDVKSATVAKVDSNPELTEYIIKKFNDIVLKMNSVPFDTRYKNDFITAAEDVMTFYNEYEEKLSRMGKDVFFIADKAMERIRAWSKTISIKPATLHSDTLFKEVLTELLSKGYISSTTEEYSHDALTYLIPPAAPVVEQTEEEKERDRLRFIVLSWPESVRKDTMIAKGIPLDILDD